MHDPLAMGRLQPLEDLSHHRQRLFLGHGPVPGNPLFQGFTDDQLHDHVMDAGLFIGVIDLDDPRVLQFGRGAGLPDQGLGEALSAEFRAEDLDRHGAVQSQMMGTVDVSHAALSQQSVDTARAEGPPDQGIGDRFLGHKRNITGVPAFVQGFDTPPGIR